MSIMQNDIIMTIMVNTDPAGKLMSWNAAMNDPPLFASNEKKLEKFSQNFHVTPFALPEITSKLTTTPLPKHMPKSVAIKMPIITAPLTLKCASMAIAINETSATSAVFAAGPKVANACPSKPHCKV